MSAQDTGNKSIVVAAVVVAAFYKRAMQPVGGVTYRDKQGCLVLVM